MITFKEFPKIPRFSRNCVVTEKIDGTNASIYVPELPEDATTSSGRVMPFLTGSRTRWIFPENDNYGFSRWAYEHVDELLQLGPGHHFGEWWGQGIQRKYGLQEKRFSLFNVGRWQDQHGTNEVWQGVYPAKAIAPACCYVVPILGVGEFCDLTVINALDILKTGSKAATFFKPEGIVIFHEASGHLYKKTLEKDESPKSQNG